MSAKHDALIWGVQLIKEVIPEVRNVPIQSFSQLAATFDHFYDQLSVDNQLLLISVISTVGSYWSADNPDEEFIDPKLTNWESLPFVDPESKDF